MDQAKRERGGRKFRDRGGLPDENDDTAAGVQVIKKKNARLGVNASDHRAENPGI